MKTIIDSFPALILASVSAFILLLFAAWFLSVRGAFKSEKGKSLRLFAIIPFTSPIATLVLFFKDRKAASTALLCYLGALFVLPLGGSIARNVEKKNLDQYIAQLSSQGISIDYKDLIPKSAPDENNIWKHPFFEMMGEAGQDTEAGSAAREAINSESSPYHVFTNPKPLKGLRYSKEPDSNPLQSTARSGNPLRSLHESALSIIESRDGGITQDNTPKNWQEYGKTIVDYYRPAEDATRQLQEAINRPNDHYPFEWEKNFGMLLPHLANLRTFSRTAGLRASAAAMTGDASETFRMIELGMKLAETGDSDLLISRLVQIAQTINTLQSIRVAQQFHVGTEEQWAALFQALDQIDLPKKIPAALGAERALGHATILPMANASVFDMVSKINQLDSFSTIPASPSSFIESLFRGAIGLGWSSSAQAMVIYNWAKGLEAYEKMIENVEITYERSRSTAWNQCDVPDLQNEIEACGIFAKLLIPALDQAFKNALEGQHQVEIAKLAVALERYYIANGAYPVDLAKLTPLFTVGEPRDPMTGQSWKYTRLETNGFLLYSLGQDGEDDNGVFKKQVRGSASNEHLDDRGWYVSPAVPDLPEFLFESKPGPQTEEVSEELMEQFGIEPSVSENETN